MRVSWLIASSLMACGGGTAGFDPARDEAGDEDRHLPDPGAEAIADSGMAPDPWHEPDEGTSADDAPHLDPGVPNDPGQVIEVAGDDGGLFDSGHAVDPGTPPGGVRYVRIVTEDGPSWVAWTEIQVLGTTPDNPAQQVNLAQGRPVQASSTWEDHAPSMAVDGSTATYWNSGVFPPAWILVDLGGPCDVNKVRLLVAQSPAGNTVHHLMFGDAAGTFDTVHTFAGWTTDGQWLEYPGGGQPPQPPRGLAWVRANPMFISGLSVSIGPPPAWAVDEYFDAFHASAVHLWMTGLPAEMNGWKAAGNPAFRWVSWVNDNGASLANDELIGGLGANPPGRIGYQVGDEPGVSGQDGMEQLKTIEGGIQAIRAKDPDALIIVNFSDTVESIDEMIAYYGGQMDGDVISYDRYTLGYSAFESLAYFRNAGLSWNKPYWRYLDAYSKAGNNEFPSASDMRWDAFVGLLFGYTGHTWFLYQIPGAEDVVSALYQSHGDLSVAKTPLWDEAAQINVEMANLGRAITRLTSTDVRYIPGQILHSPQGIATWTPGAGGDEYITKIEALGGGLPSIHDLAAGFFRDDAGEIYVMVQNQQHAGADWPINNTDEVTARVHFDFSGAPGELDKTHVLSLDRRTGQVVGLALVSDGGDKASLDVRLAAGDPVLFKYADGFPFALQ